MLQTASQFFFRRQFEIYRHRIAQKLEQGVMPFRVDPFKHGLRFDYPQNSLEGLFDMAGKKRSPRNRSLGDMEFVNFRFSAKEKAGFEEWLSQGDGVTISSIHSTVQDDNKLGVSWDSTNGVFIITLMGREDSVNSGKCLTLRSNSWDRGLAAAAYVHEQIFKSGVWDVDKDGDVI